MTTLVLRSPILHVINTHYLGGVEGDAGLYVWLARSFRSHPLQALSFEANAFYPYGLVRAWSDNFLIPSAFFAALASLGFSEPASYNIVLLIAITLNGFCTYLLARYLGAGVVAGLTSGALFQSLPYFTSHLGHPQLQFAFFLPITILLSLRAITLQRVRDWFLVGVAISLAFYTTANFAVISAVTASLILCSEIIVRRRVPLAAGGIFLGLLFALPAITAYLLVGQAFGHRKLYEPFAFQASPTSLLTYSPLHPWWGSFSTENSEAWLGLGLILSCLIGAWLFRAERRALFWIVLGTVTFYLPTPFPILSPWILILSAIFSYNRSKRSVLASSALIFAALSLGPVLDPNLWPSLWSPFTTLYKLLPGFDSIRAVPRFAIVSLLALTILPVLSIRLPNYILVLVAGVALFESAQLPIPLEALPERPRLFDELKAGSSEDLVLILPMAGSLKDKAIGSWSEYATLNVRYMNWMVGIPAKLFNGYSGQRPRVHERIPYYLQNFPDLQALNQLSQIPELTHILWLGESGLSDPRITERAHVINEGILFDFKPSLEMNFQPDYLIVAPERTSSLRLKSSDSGCEVRSAIAESTDQEALKRALQGPISLIQQSAVRATVIAPTIIALQANCRTRIISEFQ